MVRTAAVLARHAPALRPRQAPAQTPRLSVVIVNYRQWPNTAALIRQLLAAEPTRRGDVEVVVVDNHSPPHRLLSRLRRRPGVSLRRWGRNRGFARAVNEGCRLSRGDWFLLLNPDVTVPEGFVEGVLALAEELASDPQAGIVGFRLHNSDGTRQLSAGTFPTLTSTLAGLALPRARRKYQRLRGRKRRRVPWVTGCCLLLRRACLQDLNGLNEDYFLYYEDVDLCQRAWARGWSVWYEPTLRITHHNPLHDRRVSPLLRLITRHSLLTYAARHWPHWQLRVLAGVVQLEAWGRRLWAWWQGKPDEVELFRELGRLAADMGRGDECQARRRLNRHIRAEEGT